MVLETSSSLPIAPSQVKWTTLSRIKRKKPTHTKKYNLTLNTTKRMIDIWTSKKINHVEALETLRIQEEEILKMRAKPFKYCKFSLLNK